ncbi:TrpB-like pyridoxal phosphate-dependent enzyme [Capillimicrobium parvum]|uniref:Tryptophan synthase beta chain n=1 Tax=Capillimicrobium parvum TaxID=2884022 RepID=A0A9E7C2E2_9ACTN|nr:TrpB-like pyridoxal phosphate-dependent enzyme [Capillimicrobium parvum]UGS38475.1 Tryptophan synthase beta chain [Capillimicrobium parvum]
MAEPTKFLLSEDQIPTEWINLMADLPGPPLPPLSPATMQPAGPEDLAAIFPMSLIEQEVSAEPEIAIPDEVREAYRLWRPTPMFRARRLERELDTPARIYYKYEGVSPAGSHKPNTAVPQAWANKQAGITRLSTETGAGQWGSSLAFACALFGLECEVFMVGSSYDQKPYRRSMIQTWGATVHRSPSDRTEAGRSQASHPTGSLGIAISEAVEIAAQREDTNYSLGSVLNHVLLHQTVIGVESIAQMELAGDEPDVVIACVGGGSNFGGIAIPFLRRVLRGEAKTLFIAAEPAACPTLTRGAYRYDFGDTVGLTPLMPMYTLGHDFVPPPVHAGGLRYHGDSPLVSALVKEGLVEARAYRQNTCFAAALQFARTEGIIAAPESSHAIRAAIDEAEAAREAGEARVILFNLSGHGDFDMAAYDAYLAGNLEDPEFSEADMEAALARLPQTPAIA